MKKVMKKKKKEENLVAWSDLVDDVQRALMAQLNPFDRIRFRAVCRNWLLSEEDKNHRIEDKLPWLLTFDWLDEKLACGLYDPIHTNPYLQVEGIQAVANDSITMSKHHHVTSKHGWVLFSLDIKYSTIFFLISPLTKQIIKLPILHRGLEGPNDINSEFSNTLITFSTPPDSSDCVFFMVRDYMLVNKFTISTYRRHVVDKKSDTWITKVFIYSFELEIIEAVYADTSGILYLAWTGGRMAIYIVATEQYSGPFFSGVPILKLRGRVHLFESNGDLLVVDNITVQNVQNRVGPRVFKYDWFNKRFVLLNNLRDQGLFIGTHNSFAVKADDQTRNVANKIHYIGSSRYWSKLCIHQLEDENGSGKLQTSYDADSSGYYSYISNEFISRNNMIWIEPPLHLSNK